MNRILIAGAAALGLVAGGAALAQTSTTTTTTSTTVTTDQKAKIKAFMMKDKPKSVAAPTGFTVTSGATLPSTVELQSFPADVGVTSYRYSVVGDRTVVVDPGTRKIIEVIE